ncbi:MAG: triphosphoribosyl-dephospho-CoA synthase [Pirellula sp.]
MRTVGDQVRIAIVRECSAPKLGNVFPGADFADMSYETFCKAASAIGAAVDQLQRSNNRSVDGWGVGYYCSHMVQAMMESTGKNTSLGTILLLAPLLVSGESKKSMSHVLANMNDRDTALVYESIRMANPGGMGKADQMDVHESSPTSLLEAMRFASSYDDVALQYVSEFGLVTQLAQRITELVKSSAQEQQRDGHGEGIDSTQLAATVFNRVVQRLQIEVLAGRVDSLIARKSGIELAQLVMNQCREILRAQSSEGDWQARWSEMDHWMREKRNSEEKQLANPGTTADLIAAAIFFCMQNGLCDVPDR